MPKVKIYYYYNSISLNMIMIMLIKVQIEFKIINLRKNLPVRLDLHNKSRKHTKIQELRKVKLIMFNNLKNYKKIIHK